MIRFDNFSICYAVLFEMIPSLCQYPGTAVICNRFLTAMDKDPHSFCTNFRGKERNTDDCWGDCHSWSDEMWIKVSDYHSKLALQREEEEES